MEHAATAGNLGPGTSGMALQQAVFAGLVDPSNLVSISEVLNAPPVPADCGSAKPLNCDVAVFSGPASSYKITATPASGITLASLTGRVLSQRSSAVQGPAVRSLRMTLPAGSYRFVVRARNRIGLGTTSARSNQVRAR